MRWVALLRGINVGATRKLPMAELRELCATLGWREVATYIQSGNIIFTADGTAPELEAILEQAIAARFGLDVPVIVRSAGEWPRYAATPFEEAARVEPNRLMLMLSKQPPASNAESAIEERARDGEQVAVSGDAVWIHYPAGSGTSRLSPSLLDRLIGSPATSRNYRTILKLKEMLSA
jgi:uncharacterized protein (DUF1697 family)